MERLQRIRALLVEVREDLKAGEGEIVTASDADMTDADAVPMLLPKMLPPPMPPPKRPCAAAGPRPW